MELFSRKPVEIITYGFDLTPEEKKRSERIFGVIQTEVWDGEHGRRKCFYGGLMASVPTLEEVAMQYNLPLDRARSSARQNCLYPEYTNVIYFYPRGRNRPQFWFVQK